MSPRAAALALITAPLVWAYALTVAAVALITDLLFYPVVARGRARGRPFNDPPPSRNASIIVLNYNGERFLDALLPSLVATADDAPGEHEIIVVDNGSTDRSCEIIERHARVRMLRLPENVFFIRGNRAGVEIARGDVLVFVNNDMVVEKEFLRHLLEPFAAGDLIAVTARIEMDGDRVETGRTRAAYRRGAFHFVQVDGPDANENPAREIPALWAGGGSSAFDRAKYETLCGFEDLYEPCYVEDVSLSYQAWKRGWRVLFEPRSGVHHAHQATSSIVFGNRRRDRIDHRNRELFFWRAITDVRMVLTHALWLPWNLAKQAKSTGFGVQILALFLAIPRLPEALLARQRTRASQRRTDREILDVATHVRRHRVTREERHARPTVLSLGSRDEPLDVEGCEVVHCTITLAATPRTTPEALLGGVPQRFRTAAGIGHVIDQLRNAVCETDWDAVYFRDPWVLAATPIGLVDGPAFFTSPPDLAAGEARFVARVARRHGAERIESASQLASKCGDFTG